MVVGIGTMGPILESDKSRAFTWTSCHRILLVWSTIGMREIEFALNSNPDRPRWNGGGRNPDQRGEVETQITILGEKPDHWAGRGTKPMEPQPRSQG
ncbi:hypothetical protein TIFTF001_054042, partial [Ficus carica]